jgi:hypothetical protein
MRVMNRIERAAIDAYFQRSTLNVQRLTFNHDPVMLSEAKHLGSEILRSAQNDSFGYWALDVESLTPAAP